MSNVNNQFIKHKIGSQKLFENDKITVWSFELEPGEETAVHTHERSYMWYALQGAPLQIYDKNGVDVGIFDVPTGGVFSLKCENDIIEVVSELGKGATVPATHKAKNVGPDRYHEILVEWK